MNLYSPTQGAGISIRNPRHFYLWYNASMAINNISNLRHAVSLKSYNTYRVGGVAKFFVEAGDKEAVQKAIYAAESDGAPYMILGGGTNVLVSDKGFDGLIIKAKHNQFRVYGDNTVFAEAGIPVGALLNKLAALGLSGLEWAAGLPGTLGGAIFGNAGALGGEMADAVMSVEVFDSRMRDIKEYSKDMCGFGYRRSLFKNEKHLVILGATLKLRNGSQTEIMSKITESIKSRAHHQPLAFRSAGCTFKNVDLAALQTAQQLVENSEEFQGFKNARFLSAGMLIDIAGLKGFKIGGAMVSEKHGNFILNANGASAEDIFWLIEIIKNKVFEKYGILLEEEIQYIGEFPRK